jgi:hypothetical protein
MSTLSVGRPATGRRRQSEPARPPAAAERAVWLRLARLSPLALGPRLCLLLLAAPSALFALPRPAPDTPLLLYSFHYDTLISFRQRRPPLRKDGSAPARPADDDDAAPAADAHRGPIGPFETRPAAATATATASAAAAAAAAAATATAAAATAATTAAAAARTERPRRASVSASFPHRRLRAAGGLVRGRPRLADQVGPRGSQR